MTYRYTDKVYSEGSDTEDCSYVISKNDGHANAKIKKKMKVT